MDLDTGDLQAAAETLVGADTAVALTGAGVSTESGIPDFRSDGGVWDEFDEGAFTVTRFQRDPGEFWVDWLALQDHLVPDDAAPNAAHRTLAALESAGYLDAVLTQNIDGLHQEAGTRHVVELHGSGNRADCRGCGTSFDAATAADRARDGEGPPRCENCGDVLEPGAVLFGERLPDQALGTARRLVDEAGAMLVVGTSLTVEPVAALPRRAAETGASLVVVNAERTRVADTADHTFRGTAGTVVPELASRVVEERDAAD